MLDRRFIAAIAAITLLVAAALLIPRPNDPEEALEPTAVAGSIANAIDDGADASLAGLLPTSEAYQRAVVVVNGLKNGIPSPSPTLTSAQLSEVTAFSRGAVRGALTSPSTMTTPEERDRLAAFAQGYTGGAISEIQGIPSAARNAVDEAAAQGTFMGVATMLIGPEPIIPLATYESYAYTYSSHLFAELSTGSEQLSAIAGSAALADVTTLAALMVQNQIEGIPNGAPASQLEAIAIFGAGGVDGMIVGMVTSFPNGLPAADRAQLAAYFEGMTEGPDGVAPWTVPDVDSYGEFLVTYAGALGPAATQAVKDAVTTTTDPDTLAEIRALAEGLAAEAPERVAGIATYAPAIKQDVHDYLDAIANPSMDAILGRTHLPSEPAAIGAYVKGLTGGIEDLTGEMADSAGLTEAYLGGLTGSITDFPLGLAPGNAEMLTGYAEGVTNRITERMNAIQETVPALVTDEDVELIAAMAEGLATGSIALAVSEHVVAGSVLESMGDALIGGVIVNGELEDAFIPVNGLLDEVSALFAAAAEVTPSALYDQIYHSEDEQEAIAAAFGEVWGGIPARWGLDRAAMIGGIGFDVAADALWMATAAEIAGNAYIDSIEPDVDPLPEPADISVAAKLYLNNVMAAAALDPLSAATNLTLIDYPAHATNFATLATLPLAWLGGVPTEGEIGAADAILEATKEAALDTDRFTNSTYMAAITDIHIGGIVEGIVGDPGGNGTDPAIIDEYLPSWVSGMLDAIWESELAGDIEARVDWIATSTAVIGNIDPTLGQVTDDQKEATKQFAYVVTQWALASEDHIPHPGDLEKPLLPFAEASIRTGLGALPPVLTPDEQDAVVSYLFGIVRAIDQLPPYAFSDMTALDTAAMGAYVKGIASGVGLVADDLHSYLCSGYFTGNKVPPTCPAPPPPPPPPPPQCDDDLDNDGDGKIDFLFDHECASLDDNREAPDPAPQCSDGIDNDNDGKIDFGRALSNDPDCERADDPTELAEVCNDHDCMIEGYVVNVGTWAESLTGTNILTYDHTEPTAAGLVFITTWAHEVLGGHGVCPDFEDKALQCDEGPTPPVVDFALQRQEQVEAYAKMAAGPFESLVELDLPIDADTTVGTLTGPMMAWLQGIKTAQFDLFDGGDPIQLPEEDPDTGFPDPQGENFLEALEAWSSALYHPEDTIIELLQTTPPPTPGIQALAADLTYLQALVLTRGGHAAIETVSAGTQISAEQTAALDAYADALVAAAGPDLIDPALGDLSATLAWYQGLAYGGVEAILTTDFDGTIASQTASIVAYADYLATEYEPPQPDVEAILSGSNSPPTPGERPNETPSGGGNGGGTGGGTGGNAGDSYLDNIQAHAIGLARHVVNGPHQPGSNEYFRYLGAIVDAAADLPAVTPRDDYAEILADWTAQEASGALILVPSQAPTEQDVNARRAAIEAYVGGFASASPWALPAEIERNSAWAKHAILAGAAIFCPAETSPGGCAELGRVLGEAFGQSIPAQPDLNETPDPALLPSIVTGIIEALTPNNDPDPDPEPEPDPDPSNETWTPPELDPIVQGIIEGLVPEGAADTEVALISKVVTEALLRIEGQLPPEVALPLAEVLASELLDINADPATYQGLANGAIAAAMLAAGDLAADPNPETASRAAQEFLNPTTGTTNIAISVSDGVRTYGEVKLGGNEALDALREITYRVYVSTNSPINSNWELVWGTNADLSNGVHRKLAEDATGVYYTTMTPVEMVNLARGARIHFYVIQTEAGQAHVHQNGANAFAFIPDRDAPTASLAPIGAPDGASFSVAWSGADGDTRVTSYRIQMRDGQGAWSDWIKATTDTSASFSGAAGHTYTFRVTAIDPVGHESVQGTTVSATIPPSAPANRAPTIAFVTPAANAVFGRTISADISASDPDGTQPMLRVCVRKVGATSDLVCPIEGKSTKVTIDASKLADGKYLLHATATDGTLSASAMSPTFVVDRAPPVFRGVVADATKERVLLTASISGDATRVLADAGGRSIVLADDGKAPDVRANDGIWTGATTLSPGEHTISFRASDANGNEATTTKRVVVPAATTAGSGSGSGTGPAGSGSGTATGGSGSGTGGSGTGNTTGGEDTDAIPPATPTTPGEGEGEGSGSAIPAPPLAFVLLALGAIAIALRRREN